MLDEYVKDNYFAKFLLQISKFSFSQFYVNTFQRMSGFPNGIVIVHQL